MTDFDLVAIERRLQPYVEEAGRLSGRDITIDRTLELARLVGSPHQRLRVVHVAGTSGKTSTSYYMAALLKQAGCQVGLTVSPHIDSITDRVQVGGQPLGDREFIDMMNQFLSMIDRAPERPTYFELMMVFAFWVFDQKGVDYAVIETGLGGLHDSSNICQRPDKLAIITDIGLDHVRVLGDSIGQISKQKLGIVHPKNTIVMHRQADEVMSVVQRTVEQQRSELVIASLKNVDDRLPLFQRRNWSLAKSGYDYLANRDNLLQLTDSQLQDTQLTSIPGRMDVFQLSTKTIVIDGAHNQQKLAALAESFRRTFPADKALGIVAVKQGKDIEQMAPIVAKLVDRVIVTAIEVNQDIPHQSVPLQTVAEVLNRHGVEVVEQISSNRAALGLALEQTDKLVLAVGSLYLAASLRQIILASEPRLPK